MPYSCPTFGLKRPLASERLISRISQHPTYVKQISLCSGLRVTRPDITIIYITENLFSHNSPFTVTYAYTYIAYLLQQFIEVFNKYILFQGCICIGSAVIIVGETAVFLLYHGWGRFQKKYRR